MGWSKRTTGGDIFSVWLCVAVVFPDQSVFRNPPPGGFPHRTMVTVFFWKLESIGSDHILWAEWTLSLLDIQRHFTGFELFWTHEEKVSSWKFSFSFSYLFFKFYCCTWLFLMFLANELKKPICIHIMSEGDYLIVWKWRLCCQCSLETKKWMFTNIDIRFPHSLTKKSHKTPLVYLYHWQLILTALDRN